MNDVTLLAKALKKIADVLKEAANKAMVNALAKRIHDLENKTNNGVTIEQVKKEIAKIVDGAPEEFDTLKELSEALKEEKNAVAAMNKVLATKANKSDIPDVTHFVSKPQHTEDLLKKADKIETTITNADLKKAIEAIANS